MSTTGAPVPLTPGKTTIIRPPDGVQQTSAVVLQNLSPYLLAVTAGGNAYTLPNYTADLYRTASIGTPLEVLPTNPDNTSGVSANVLPIWFGPGEDPTHNNATSYPASLSPPPVAVGVAVAAALLAGGIPNVLVVTDLGNHQDDTLDVRGYASLTITGVGASAAAVEGLSWHDDLGNFIASDNVFIGGGAGVIVPVLATTLTLSGGWVVHIDGSNRPAPSQHSLVAGHNSTGYTATFSRTWVAGDIFNLTPVKGALFQGPCFGYFTVGGAAVTGSFEAGSGDGALYVLADTGEMHTAPQNRSVSKMLALPGNIATLEFHCAGTGGLAAVNAYLIPAY